METTYGSAVTCEGYREYADIYVSLDGSAWYFAKTVCKYDPLVDISDAGPFSHINYVKIVSNDQLSTTHDAFDVDGVIALHNCEEVNPAPVPGLVIMEAQNQLSTSPNPTKGASQVIFTTATTGKTFVDVYDMNGRKIATLFDQVTQEGQEYTFDFNGVSLPNGFYVYILTNNGETIIERFLIAK